MLGYEALKRFALEVLESRLRGYSTMGEEGRAIAALKAAGIADPAKEATIQSESEREDNAYADASTAS